MVAVPEAFLLLSLPGASLASTGAPTEKGILNLECVNVPNPASTDSQDRDVYLVLTLNATETPIDPASVVRRSEAAGLRTYSFAGTQAYPTDLTLTIKVPRSNDELLESLDTFESILQQYALEFHDTSSAVPPTIAGQSTTVDIKKGNKDLRGHLVMINEDTGEVVGEVEDRFRIREDPVMHERGHESDPVIIEVEESRRESDANALEAFARIVPPDQRNWITSSANIVSHAISMTTNLLLTTITTASSLYIAHSSPSPHHSNAATPSGSKGPSPAPPPLPPRALVFLTSEKTRKGLSTVHTISGEAVKVSAKTIGLIDKMIRRAMGANPKRTKYFPHGNQGSGPSSASLTTGPPLPPRTPSPSSRAYVAPPPYSSAGEKSSSLGVASPPLPHRQSPSPGPPPLPSRSGAPVARTPTNVPPQLPPRLRTKDHILISADLILSTIDHSTRRVLDVGTEQIGKVIGHKYGPEAAQSSLLMAGTARNMGLVYIDMRGIGRRALLRHAGKTFVKARMSSNTPGTQPQYPAPAPTPLK